jgi:hypothetical protein
MQVVFMVTTALNGLDIALTAGVPQRANAYIYMRRGLIIFVDVDQ